MTPRAGRMAEAWRDMQDLIQCLLSDPRKRTQVRELIQRLAKGLTVPFSGDRIRTWPRLVAARTCCPIINGRAMIRQAATTTDPSGSVSCGMARDQHQCIADRWNRYMVTPWLAGWFTASCRSRRS